MKATQQSPQQAISADRSVADIQGLSGVQGLMDWGSNLERIQALFGQGGGDSAQSTRSEVPASATNTAVDVSTKEEKSTAAPRGLDAPMLDQNEFDHWNRGAFCGLATMAMMLQANGKNAGTAPADLEQYAGAIYNKSAGGTSGAAMAGYLREQGLENSSFTTKGTTSRLVSSLQAGQTVPFGVLHSAGEVTRLKGGQSARYRHLKVGDRHYHQFQGSGHWLLVTRFEGKPDKPTAFYVNDPDLGGELKCTLAELEAMADGDGNYWMVEQRP